MAWMRHLLKLRASHSEVFAQGNYEPLGVSGPQRDHVVAFARRHGRNAVITAVARWFAPLTEGGRSWPRADAFDGALHIDGYAIEGFNDKNETASIPLSSLFAHIPAAVLEARSIAAKVPVKRSRQFA
jgi:(1->4)-alpha-D-glucan 1-alpha-D-glucosylmutase